MGILGLEFPMRDQSIPVAAEKKISLAEVAKTGNSQHILVPQPITKKMTKAKQMLDLSQTRVKTDPCQAAVYFRKMRPGSIGKIQEALRKCFSALVLLRFSFVGGSVMNLSMTTDWRKI